jgi:nitrite reductase/ring-hydroxylating ferredoxin subunit
LNERGHVVARVAKDALEDGKPVRVPYPPFDIVVVRTGEQFLAIEDACNHSGASLAAGAVSGTEISCPLHGYVFDLRSGALLRPKRLCGPQRAFDTEVQGDEVLIREHVAASLIPRSLLPK